MISARRILRSEAGSSLLSTIVLGTMISVSAYALLYSTNTTHRVLNAKRGERMFNSFVEDLRQKLQSQCTYLLTDRVPDPDVGARLWLRAEAYNLGTHEVRIPMDATLPAIATRNMEINRAGHGIGFTITSVTVQEYNETSATFLDMPRADIRITADLKTGTGQSAQRIKALEARIPIGFDAEGTNEVKLCGSTTSNELMVVKRFSNGAVDFLNQHPDNRPLDYADHYRQLAYSICYHNRYAFDPCESPANVNTICASICPDCPQITTDLRRACCSPPRGVGGGCCTVAGTASDPPCCIAGGPGTCPSGE